MRILKYIVVLLVFICLFQTVEAKKRYKPIPMKELTDKSSPSFVPIPYPKNRREIIVDLKYWLNKTFGPDSKSQSAGRQPKFVDYLEKVLDERSGYGFGKISKIINYYSTDSYGYKWQILIEDPYGKIVALTLLSANGLGSGASSVKPERGRIHMYSDGDIVDILSDSIEKHVSQKDIKRIHKVSYNCLIAGNFLPAWKIELNNGQTYFYSMLKDCIYGIKQKKKWGKRPNGKLKRVAPNVNGKEPFLRDDINEQIILLKKYKRRK